MVCMTTGFVVPRNTGTGISVMSPTLAETLIAHAPRENSGTIATNRFEYQRTWALCHLLRLHGTTDDYVMVLEYHDDVIVLDSASAPTSIQTYQVKTKEDGHWTLAKLLGPSDDKGKKKKQSKAKKEAAATAKVSEPSPRSILAKLADTAEKIGGHLRGSHVVSNAVFSVTLSDGADSTKIERICLSLLSLDEQQKIREAIKKELGLSSPPSIDKFHLTASAIGIKGHNEHGAGALSEFLERRRPGGRYAVQALYKTLCGELSRRTTNEWSPTSFAELCAKKGISRAEFESFLVTAEAAEPDPEEQWKEISSALTAEKTPYKQLTELQDVFRRYHLQRTDRSNVPLQEFASRVEAVVQKIFAAEWNTLNEFLQKASDEFVARHGEPQPPFNSVYLRGAILRELTVHQARQHASSASKPAKEEP